MFRNVLLAAVAAAVIAAPASAQTNGSLEVSRTNHDFGSGDFDVTGVNGSIFHGFGNGFGVQGDIQYHDLDFGSIDYQNTRYTVHGLYRTETWAAGALLGKADWFSFDLNYWGLEGAYYLDRWTFQGSYISGEIDSSIDQSMDRFNVAGRYFFTDNFSVGGGVGFASYETVFGDIDWNSYDVNAEYRFGSLPVAVFAGYNRGDFDGSADDTDSLRVGVRWDIGTGSLIERDRQGASFNDIEAYVQDLYRLD